MAIVKFEKKAEEALTVYNKSVYFSLPVRKKLKMKAGESFEFFTDLDTLAIIVKAASKYEAGRTYKLDNRGYCGTKIATVMPIGRYTYQGDNGGQLIFRQIAKAK